MRPKRGAAVLVVVAAAALLPAAPSAAVPFNSPGLIRGLKQYPVPGGLRPNGLAFGPEGDFWFAQEYEGLLGRITPSGEITELSVPGKDAGLAGIASDSEHRLWFTEPTASRIGMLDPGGNMTEYPLPVTDNGFERGVSGIAAGNGFMWYVIPPSYPRGSSSQSLLYRGPTKVGEITTSGVTAEFTLPGSVADPRTLTVDAKGDLWITESPGTLPPEIRIRRMTPTGNLSERTLPDEASSGPITEGPEGNMWLIEHSETLVDKLLRISPRWQIRRFTLPRRADGFTSQIQDVTFGPDGNLWYVGSNPSVVGRVTPSGEITQAKLPTSASVPRTIIRGPKRTLWFTEWRSATISRFSVPKASKHRRH